jgi:hypothetical protein
MQLSHCPDRRAARRLAPVLGEAVFEHLLGVIRLSWLEFRPRRRIAHPIFMSRR